MRCVSLVVGAVCLSGCDGVFGLTHVNEEVGDAFNCPDAIGHDEDHDAIDDACDPCPFSPENDGDGDGDGIAFACDPDIAKANTVLLFDGFGSSSAAELVGATIVNDAMHVSLPTMGFVGFEWGQDVDNVWVMASASVGDSDGTDGYRELGFVFDQRPENRGTTGTFCVLGKGQTDYVQAYASPTVGTDEVLGDNVQQPLQIVNFTSGTMRGFYSRNSDPQVGCVFEQGGLSGMVEGTRTPLPPPGRLGIYVDDVSVDIGYVFIVSRP